MLRIRYKVFSFTVDTANQTYFKKFDLDKNIEMVRGLQLSSNKPDQIFTRGTQKIEVSGDELFPDDFESKNLQSGINVPPDERFVDLGDVLPGNGEVKIWYKDADNGSVFNTYTVNLVLRCQLKQD